MAFDLNDLSALEKDALKEIGNIGAGNAATALAELLNCDIDMSVPAVEIVPIEEAPEVTGDLEQKIGAVLLQVEGEAPGSILLSFGKESLEHLLKTIFQHPPEADKLTKIEISALNEVGNILSGSYLNALNQLTGFSLMQSVPVFAYDMAGAILSTSLLHISRYSDYTLLIKTQFMNGRNRIEGYFFYIPDPGSLEKILTTLGFDLNERNHD